MKVIKCDTKTTITNMITGHIYKDEEECQEDIKNSDTSTEERHIKRDVLVIAPMFEISNET